MDEPLIDPRAGDVEDDASSPKRRSLLAIAGSLLAEISLPKLILAVFISLVLPAILLGLAPLVMSAWLLKVSGAVAELTGVGAALFLLVIAGLGWIGWRPLFRIAEANFWSLNALAIQPSYAVCREALRHVLELAAGADASSVTRARLRAASSAVAGILLFVGGALVAAAAWQGSRWVVPAADLLNVRSLILPALANAVVVISVYFSAASLVWGIADAAMPQPMDVSAFAAAEGTSRWRIAHLSDIHQVGEQYGFRIESGRSGPRGNERFARILARLEDIHRAQPLDIVLITGDMTDAGRAAEWAEFLDALARHQALAERTLVLPGNHDLNIVDRLNPARLDLPFSPGKRLRQMRALSAMAAVQGERVFVVERGSHKLDRTLAQTLAPHRGRIAAFADAGGLRQSAGLGRLWDEQFPMVVPPASADGLGVAILNSNAEAHFSFTNALGMVPAEQARALFAALDQFPRARWIIALHHHLMEYPMPAAALSERVGTALINGSWFVRKLGAFAGRAIVMHGHRHIDWIGTCGDLKIVSAPSPVMGATNEVSTHFHVLTLTAGPAGRIDLLPPERVEIAGTARAG
jgi:hypothetical protein